MSNTDNEILEGSKLIAKFMDEYDLFHWERDPFNEFLKAKYHLSWDCQIPVWGKVALAVKTLIPKLPNPQVEAREYFRKLSKYENAVFRNEPLEGQKIIVELLQWYNKNKQS